MLGDLYMNADLSTPDCMPSEMEASSVWGLGAESMLTPSPEGMIWGVKKGLETHGYTGFGKWAPEFAPGEPNLYGVDFVGGLAGAALAGVVVSLVSHARSPREKREQLVDSALIGALFGMGVIAGIGVARSLTRGEVA